jgi:hypothetical protein
LSTESDPDHDWPAERQTLLERYPRSSWGAAASIEAAFWLDVHARFRRACADLEGLLEDYRQHRRTAHELAVMAAPRLAGLLTEVHGHHQIEDFHYFPAFRRLAPKLAAGIDLLEQGHTELQQDIAAARDALKELQAAVAVDESGRDADLAVRRYVTAASRLCHHLCRHLTEEEDLVVPLLLEHGDL